MSFFSFVLIIFDIFLVLNENTSYCNRISNKLFCVSLFYFRLSCQYSSWSYVMIWSLNSLTAVSIHFTIRLCNEIAYSPRNCFFIGDAIGGFYNFCYKLDILVTLYSALQSTQRYRAISKRLSSCIYSLL